MTIVSSDAAWRRLLDTASAPYRAAGRFAWHFARGKLGMDPVFRHLLSQGQIPPGSRVLDIGCGQGLLASLLLAAGATEPRPELWPQEWPAPPRGTRVTGIELMSRDVERARAALGAAGDAARFVCGDMRQAEFPPSDVVVILDVLHYVNHAEQNRVLERVRDALSPGGRLLLRVGDAESRRGFAISQWVDRLVTWTRGHRVPPTFGRPLAAWIAQLQSLGFDVEPRPMSQGTPFANVLLVAQRRAAPGAPA
ncbi:SAM-dependent methyltransferase [Caldimonas brevitalea]|uniref:Methyltransferase type 11 n=1 Tax=Caldimonas brevitalea TaxID=413882 RepID=A0A0G3BR53_9BURK|nr:class I SAM-dependent methyltransferase [Caldimonas brevitalea]AKJ30473.1 methyltransferase type 11 [Caldimonas brevitalea]